MLTLQQRICCVRFSNAILLFGVLMMLLLLLLSVVDECELRSREGNRDETPASFICVWCRKTPKLMNLIKLCIKQAGAERQPGKCLLAISRSPQVQHDTRPIRHESPITRGQAAGGQAKVQQCVAVHVNERCEVGGRHIASKQENERAKRKGQYFPPKREDGTRWRRAVGQVRHGMCRGGFI